MEITQQLVVDIGNTRCKVALFQGNDMLQHWVYTDHFARQVEEVIATHKAQSAILSSVGKQADDVKEKMQVVPHFIELTHQVAVPFANEYQTPHTLGMDRVAGIAGALHFFENSNCLVIDLGTCVTYDFITAGNVYKGGAIAPGLNMRLDAMAHFTQKLPRPMFDQIPESFIGTTTQTSLLSGAYYGLLGEINETIERYERQFGVVQVLMCGGDASLFDKHTKKSIFAAPDLVLYGLNKLLTYNAT